MGLGKTLQVLALIWTLLKQGPEVRWGEGVGGGECGNGGPALGAAQGCRGSSGTHPCRCSPPAARIPPRSVPTHNSPPLHPLLPPWASSSPPPRTQGRPAVQRALVVTPASLTHQWCTEARKWLGNERLRLLALSSSAAEARQQVGRWGGMGLGGGPGGGGPG